MGRYDSLPDLSMQRTITGTGASLQRRCWVCNRNRALLGGQTDKRTRLWRCAECVQKGTK